MTDDIQQIAEEAVAEAREGFELEEVLTGTPSRFKTIRVFTDEATGEELGGVEVERNEQGLPTGIRRWGLAKVIAELQVDEEANAAELKKARAKAKSLAKKLDSTALDIELQAVPRVVKKDARRKARKELGIKGHVPEDLMEDYADEFDAQILSRSVVSIYSVAKDAKNRELTVAGARHLRNMLPESEYGRLDRAVSELQFRAVIAEKATSNADF